MSHINSEQFFDSEKSAQEKPYKWIRVKGGPWHRLTYEQTSRNIRTVLWDPNSDGPCIQAVPIECAALGLKVDWNEHPKVDLRKTKPRAMCCRACKRADRKKGKQK